MTRLIDADALINTLQKFFDMREQEQIFTGGRGVNVTWNDAIYHIKSAPTIDAVPYERIYDEWCTDCKEYDREKHCCPRFNHVIRDFFKRGSWSEEQYSDTAFYVYRCSNCGSVFISRTKYCPNCGSLMNGGKEV